MPVFSECQPSTNGNFFQLPLSNHFPSRSCSLNPISPRDPVFSQALQRCALMHWCALLKAYFSQMTRVYWHWVCPPKAAKKYPGGGELFSCFLMIENTILRHRFRANPPENFLLLFDFLFWHFSSFAHLAETSGNFLPAKDPEERQNELTKKNHRKLRT